VHVRCPRLDYESHATGLDRNELGSLLVAAGLGTPAEHALVSLLAQNGLRVSEATGADIRTRGSSAATCSHPGIVILRLADQSAATVSKAIGDLASLAEPENLAGAVAVLQRGLLRIRHP